ncbi:MAG: nucleotidyltransferase domain-containing protein [Anaerolineae bacterium]|nr:nucleotidyltransferase domain-containing protein [Anaerolineae bacterium]
MQPFVPLPAQMNNRDDLKRRLSAVLSLYPVSAAYLYGSAVSGKMMPWSDIDIALVMSPQTFDPKRRLELELEIEDKVACDANIRRADVRIILLCNLKEAQSHLKDIARYDRQTFLNDATLLGAAKFVEKTQNRNTQS